MSQKMHTADSGSKFYVLSHGGVVDFYFLAFLEFPKIVASQPSHRASQKMPILDSGSKLYVLSHGGVVNFVDLLGIPKISMG